jgi:hypothetical protein
VALPTHIALLAVLLNMSPTLLTLSQVTKAA